MRLRWPGMAEWWPVSTGVMVGLRDLTHAMKLAWWLSDAYSRTLQSSGSLARQSRFVASKWPRSTETKPSVPIHLAPPRMSPWPPAMIIVISLGYLRVMRYLVQVFQMALSGGNSPTLL